MKRFFPSLLLAGLALGRLAASPAFLMLDGVPGESADARHKGWIGVVLDRTVDWEEVAALVRRSWRMTAPRRLAATLPPDDAGPA